MGETKIITDELVLYSWMYILVQNITLIADSGHFLIYQAEFPLKDIAKSSFDFLLSKTFNKNTIRVISNKTWLHKGNESKHINLGGEQPIDVAYTILALSKFYDVFLDEDYLNKMKISINWFLGNNHLNQIIYNPCTGGCYDGLEENYVNLNQGAESTVSYLMARITVEKCFKR